MFSKEMDRLNDAAAILSGDQTAESVKVEKYHFCVHLYTQLLVCGCQRKLQLVFNFYVTDSKIFEYIPRQDFHGF